ncbi:hypothetical protein SO802_013132 [Lithocarpus litseifolius]|uniref:SWIM-type domain-containing protein n=1 Tax=Lithocarpus litseifolius TaxID=425828 RepID=A0AAW2DA95_9ROSI
MDPPSSIPSNHPWMTIGSPMEARMMDNSCQNKDTMNDCTPEETRTNCLVQLGVSLVREPGKYKVYDFVLKHNHVFHLAATTFMMRSERKMSDVQAFAIDVAYASRIKPKEIHELMSREAGGRANLGYTGVDQKNYLQTRRQQSLINGEASSLLRYFQQQLIHNPSFHYAIQLDIEEQITIIFWADAKMIIDYAHFGDVFSFDTTFGTNKEFRPLAMFIGFNHHREMVIFGAALLHDEMAESFEWLFESFLNTNGGRKPKSIFTYQEFAIAKASAEVMPKTWHGLCTWHIMQNGIKKLGNLMKDGSLFLRDFKDCMYKYENESEFEEAWNKMIQHFEMVVRQKRDKELEAENNAREKLPLLCLKNSPLLKQASQVYSRKIFKLFQNEYDYASTAIIEDRNCSQPVHEYTIVLLKKVGEYIVLCSPISRTISCNCRKFETFGILCCHALKACDFDAANAMDVVKREEEIALC